MTTPDICINTVIGSSKSSKLIYRMSIIKFKREISIENDAVAKASLDIFLFISLSPSTVEVKIDVIPNKRVNIMEKTFNNVLAISLLKQ